MTIALKIENTESPDDPTKELLLEVLREDGTVQSHDILRGGTVTTVHIWALGRLRLSERYMDRAPGRPVLGGE